MRIVFWQNCLSPHQLPYIVHLMDDKRVDEVVVVTEESISDERKKNGLGTRMLSPNRKMLNHNKP